MRRSVPWRLSMKGETTAIRTGGIRWQRSLRADLHEFTPALENKKIPDARPAHGALRPLVAIPEAIPGRRFQDARLAKPVRRKRFLQHVAQVVRQPALKWKREGAFPPGRQIRQKSGRQESLRGVQQKPLLLDANARRNGKQKLHH